MKSGEAIRQVSSELFCQIFPRRCALCAETLAPHDAFDLCDTCKSDLPLFTGAACTICGIPIDGELEGAGIVTCGHCRIKKPPYDATVFSLEYRDSTRELIHRFKFQGRQGLAKTLALLLCARLHAKADMKSIDLIIPLPLHPLRIYERGYNQSFLLADEIARAFSLPLAPDAMTRRHHTDKLSHKTRAERLKAIKNAFIVKRPAALKGRHILLVDDIMTTGATMHEAAKTLKKAGATSVVCAVCARA